MAPMGRSFKAPKKSNILQWKKVEKLWLAGIRFPTIWGGVYRPKRWQDAGEYIRLVQLHQLERDRVYKKLIKAVPFDYATSP